MTSSVEAEESGDVTGASEAAALVEEASYDFTSEVKHCEATSGHPKRLVTLPSEYQVKRRMSERLPSSDDILVSLSRQTRRFNEIVDGRDDDVVREEPQSPLMIHPHSTFRVGWDILTLILVMYVALALPFLIGFRVEPSGALVVWERTVDVLFFADVIFNFRTGVVLREGRVLMDGWEVAKIYMRGWFLLDAASCLPFDLIFGARGGVGRLGAAKLLKIGRLLKVMKLVRLSKFVKFAHFSENSALMEWFEELMVSKTAQVLVAVMSNISLCAVLAHVLACLMAASGEGFLDNYGDSASFKCVGESSRNGGVLKGKCARPASEWRVGRQYIAGLYWAVTTMTTVGYGDIVPHSDANRIFAMLAMLIGGAFYGYVLGVIASLVALSDAHARAYSAKMGIVTSWLEHHDLPRQLRRKVRNYFKSFLQERTALDEQAILNDLDPGLRAELSAYLIPVVVRDAALCADLQPAVLSKMVQILRPVPADCGDTIQLAGVSGSTMHIIVVGAVEITYGGRKKKQDTDSPASSEETPRNSGSNRTFSSSSSSSSGGSSSKGTVFSRMMSSPSRHRLDSANDLGLLADKSSKVHISKNKKPQQQKPPLVTQKRRLKASASVAALLKEVGLDEGASITMHLGAADSFGELVALNVETAYDATAVATRPTALYQCSQEQLSEAFLSLPEVLVKLRRNAVNLRTQRLRILSQTSSTRAITPDNVVEEKPNSHMRASLVGGGDSTLPTGFADAVFEVLAEISTGLCNLQQEVASQRRDHDLLLKAFLAANNSRPPNNEAPPQQQPEDEPAASLRRPSVTLVALREAMATREAHQPRQQKHPQSIDARSFSGKAQHLIGNLKRNTSTSST